MPTPTIPTKSDNKIPMDLSNPGNSQALILANQAAGISYFHVLTKDTMGYLTKQAAHYRFQLGADPGLGVPGARESAPLVNTSSPRSE